MIEESNDALQGDPSPRTVRTPLKRWSPLPWVSQLRKAREERDRALNERDRAVESARETAADQDRLRRELRRTRDERNRLRQELYAALTSLRGELDQRESRVEQTSNEVLRAAREALALGRRTDRIVRSIRDEFPSEVQALMQLMRRYSPDAPLPIVGGWALSARGLLALTDLIETRRVNTVVECGSGTSTLWIGYALKKVGHGRVIAFEHLEEYAANTRALVASHGLSDFVEVRLAPLETRTTVRGEFLWYSIEEEDLPPSVDVLLVDGPPQPTGPHARYPALSAFARVLVPGAIVVADDTDRPDEREMLSMWFEDQSQLRRIGTPARGVEILQYGE